MKRFDLILTIACIALFSSAATPSSLGQETNAALSLDALVAEALAKNPELKFYEAEIAAAKAGRKTAGALANPEAGASLGQKRTSSPGLSDEGVAWSVSVLQPFEWPGRLGLRKSIANRDIELAQLGYERFKIALANRIRALGYGLFAAQERAAASAEVAARFKALREVLLQRDPAGLTPLLETRVIEATELTAQHKASEADIAAQAALMELNHLRGADADARLTVSPVKLSFNPAERIETLVARAATNSYEVRMRAAELAQQGFRVDLAKNERYPAISAGPTYSEEEVGGDRERIIGISVSVPLPLWNRNGGNVEAAKARQLQAETSFLLTRRETERHTRQAALTYKTKVREMTNWRPDSVKHFKDAAELADRHYRLGAVPISTYVELQQQYLEAVESLLETELEALEAAAQLEQLTGLTPLNQPTLKSAASDH